MIDSLLVKVSESLDDVTGANAASAHLNASDGALTDCLNFLQVWMPGATCFVVCVADIVSETRTFSTDFTYFGH